MSLHEQIQSILDKHTASETGAPGLVFAAYDRSGKVLTENASGVTSKGSDGKIGMDTVFWFASCTKQIAGMACLQLVEVRSLLFDFNRSRVLVQQGKLKLDEPVYDILPELKGRHVLSENGRSKPHTNPITLRMLLSHTAGFSYSFFHPLIKKWAEEKGIDEFSGEFAAVDQPLIHEPGTGAWSV
jgi:CubicO group peptidase (beta-lactamase class C family)